MAAPQQLRVHIAHPHSLETEPQEFAHAAVVRRRNATCTGGRMSPGQGPSAIVWVLIVLVLTALAAAATLLMPVLF